MDELKSTLIKNGLLLAYEEWYAINRTAFEMGGNPNNPETLYGEYEAETLREYKEAKEKF